MKDILFLCYGKCSKISNTSVFFNKYMVFRAGIHKMLVRVASREDPDQTALEAVLFGSGQFVWAFLTGN